MSHYTNIVRIKAVANALAELNEKIVFVGGATISLYPDRQGSEVRITNDVDVIVEILNYVDRTRLEEKLRLIGFVPDIESGVICRYRFGETIVDIMPTNDPSIGFTNKWYEEGFANAIDYRIDEHCTVKVLTAPYFISTKLEAFKGRGKSNGRTSQDFEDIIYVLENRDSIWEEIKNTEKELNRYLKEEFSALLQNPSLLEWIDGHVERGSSPATYFIIEELKKFVS